jgi:hypothetical protein
MSACDASTPGSSAYITHASFFSTASNDRIQARTSPVQFLASA